MDTDIENRQREDEMSRLRALGAGSPSTISTASSGSPLMRGSSAVKRPAPTSIAAAQLQCQQQQQQQNRLEFTNHLSGTAGSSKRTHLGQQPSRGASASGNQVEPADQWRCSPAELAKQSSKALQMGASNKKTTTKKQRQQQPGDSSPQDAKSLGYNLSKSLAYKAYRFNEFWSVNKMRYMNLACLIMTLVCLTTILLFSGNQNGSGPTTTAKQQQLSGREGLRVGGSPDESIGESIESIDSQPLVSSSSAKAQQVASSAEHVFDDFSLADDRRDSLKLRRKSSDPAASDGKSSEHEMEETGQTVPGKNGLQSASMESPPTGLFPPSLIDPILSQILNDMELGWLSKSIKRASNATGGNGLFSKPIIRRSKNGATIIISSSSFNESSLNDSSLALPSLLDKLLPASLNPLAMARFPSAESAGGNGSGPLGSGGFGTATITIGAEPIFASSSSPSSLSSPGGRMGAMDPFGFSASGHQMLGRLPPASLFMEPMMSLRYPSPFFGSGFGQAPPPPGLLSLLMRQATEPDSDDDQAAAHLAGPVSRSHLLGPLGAFMSPLLAHSQRFEPATGKPDQSRGSINETTPSVQASHQNSTTAESTPEVAAASESAGVSAQKAPKDPSRMHNIYSSWKKPQASSMFIFSSGSLEPPAPPRDPFQFQLGPGLSSFMTLPPLPQMMMLGGAGEAQSVSGNNPLNPILRTILNSVRTDLEGANSTERVAGQRASGSSLAPHWSTASSSPAAELDDEWNGNQSEVDRWDEQDGAKQLRALHRSMDDEPELGPLDGPAGFRSKLSKIFHLDQTNEAVSPKGDRSSLDSSRGVVSGTIRQTIRGPGMTVERIIEVPSSRFPQAQQVGAGVRLQSLSRSSPQSELLDDLGDYLGPSRTPSNSILGGAPLFPHSSIDRMSPSTEFEEFAMPHVGFIGGLLSDMSRRVNGNSDRSHQTSMSRDGRGPSRRNHLLDEEFDETDSNESQTPKPEGDKWKWASGQWAHSAPNKFENIKGKWRHEKARKRLSSNEDDFGVASPSQTQMFVREPAHFAIPDSPSGDQDKEISLMPSHLLSGPVGEPMRPVAGSFEDTMNSMEDRLNHVLSISSHGAPSNPWLGNKVVVVGDEHAADQTPGNKSLQERVTGQSVAPARSAPPPPSPSPGIANMIGLSMIGRMDSKQATSGSHIPLKLQQHNQPPYNQQQHKPGQQTENPFTSPSSPLFGFPAMSMASPASQQVAIGTNTKNKLNQASNSGIAPATTTNRKQRSFTYHSNNELASAVAQKQQQQQKDQLGVSESMARPRFMEPFDAAPASIVMGRRLDDGPNASDGMQMIMGHPFGQAASPASNGRNLINHHSGNSLGSASNQASENYRTIVV